MKFSICGIVDTIFCMASGEVQADITRVGALAAEVTALAIINAVQKAESRYGHPGCQDIHA